MQLRGTTLFRRACVAVVAVVALAGSAVTSDLADVPPSAAATANPIPSWSHTYGGWNRSSSPTIADVTGDGVPEIVHGHQDGWLRVLDPATGANVAHWPQPAIVAGGAAAIDGSPAVGDLDRDGDKEIAVGVGSTWVGGQHGGLVVFEHDGRIRCRLQTFDTGNQVAGTPNPDGYSDGVFSSPALGDVDGNGRLDVVFGAWDLRIYAVDDLCRPLAGFPYFIEDTTWSSPALHDVDGDGRVEVFIGSDQSLGGPISFAGGELRALDWTPFGVRELWRRQIGDVFHSSPAVGDVNGDGRPEAVTGGGDYYHHPHGRKVWAFDLLTGADVPGWPHDAGAVTWSSPALGDLDGNGVDEVVIGARDGWLRALRGNGSLMWAAPAGNVVNGSPVVADLDADGVHEVGVGSDNAFRVFDGRTGALERTVGCICSYETSAAVGDFGTRGWKLVLSSFDTPNVRTTIAAFDVPRPVRTPPWPMFGRTPDHHRSRYTRPATRPGQCFPAANPWWHRVVNGFATPTGDGYWLAYNDGMVTERGDAKWRGDASCAALNGPIVGGVPTRDGKGYWLVAYDGGIFTFGGAPFFGSMGGARLNQPVFSMAPTKSGRGYWLVAYDGGIFSFGDARFFGSAGGIRLNQPIIGITTSPTGRGYRMVARDGGVFGFGDVPFYGSLPGRGVVVADVVGMAPTPTNRGYWVVRSGGRVYAFGDAKLLGSHAASPFDPVTAIFANPTAQGYRLVTASGQTVAFGDAPG